MNNFEIPMVYTSFQDFDCVSMSGSFPQESLSTDYDSQNKIDNQDLPDFFLN